MAMGCAHTIHREHHHFGWDNSRAPALTVAPGETVYLETVDSSGGQLNAMSTLADLANLDFGKVNPVTGPIAIDGAQPGDAVKVTLLGFEPSGWGWTALIPGFGLLTAAIDRSIDEQDSALVAAHFQCLAAIGCDGCVDRQQASRAHRGDQCIAHFGNSRIVEHAQPDIVARCSKFGDARCLVCTSTQQLRHRFCPARPQL